MKNNETIKQIAEAPPVANEMTRRDFIKLVATGVASVTAMSVLNSLYIPASAAVRDSLQRGGATLDVSSPSITRDVSRCIGCGNCVAVCENVQQIGIYSLHNENGRVYASTKGEIPLAQTPCINCGQCVKKCPVGALSERDSLSEVLTAINDPAKKLVWQIAPSVQNMLGEEFGMPSGVDVSKKIATAMKMLGGHAFCTDFAADVTIMEEGTEFIHRLYKGGKMPLITSCCPGWIRYMELHYPSLLGHLSSCKSPQQMFGALVKNYYPQKYGVPAKDIFHVSIMPCTAKKYECARDEMKDANGRRNVDAVLTAREFAKLLRSKGISLDTLPDSDYDRLMGESSGAARIFGASGGVMEASLRAVSLLLTNKDLPHGSIKVLRSQEGFKAASVVIDGATFNFAAVNGIGNISSVMEEIQSGTCQYHFIEVMVCPGGCIGGGGTPIQTENITRRQRGLYKTDISMKNTVCMQNSEVQTLYSDYLGKPCGSLSEELLHTHYIDRSGEF